MPDFANLMKKNFSPMRGSWRLDLADGAHTVEAEINLMARLTVTWDSQVIHSGQVWTLLGELKKFQQSGHTFVLSVRGWGRLGYLVLSMDGIEVRGDASEAAPPEVAPGAPPPRVADIQFVKDLSCTETEEVVGEEEYPLDNRFGSSPFSTDRQVSKETTNELSVEVSQQLGGGINLDIMSAIKAEISAQVSRQLGCKIGEKVTESQTLHFTVGPSQSVVYQVVWKRKVLSGERLYMMKGSPVTVPYRVSYGLSCEVRTAQARNTHS